MPFNSLLLAGVTILGFVIWGEVPISELLLGSVIVVASGLYILWRRRNGVIADGRSNTTFST